MKEEMIVKEIEGIVELPEWNEPKDLIDAKNKIISLGSSMSEHAYIIGGILIFIGKECKKQHIKYEDWVDKNLWFSTTTSYKFKKFYKECKKLGELIVYSEPYPRKTPDSGVFEYKIYDVWNFSECDSRYGIDYPGRIPGQLIKNLLHYYTNENDIIIDFMAGGGTTYDVCKEMNRICYSFDKEPVRDFIIKYQLRDNDGNVKLPQLTETPNLIFVDPPYWSMMKEEYGENSISELSLKEYYDFIKKFATECYNILPQNGIFAFLIQNQTEKDIPDNEEAILHTYNCSKIIENSGFKLKRIINCPLHTETFMAQQVIKAKEEKRMLGLVRDLIIFKKEK